MTDQGNRFLLYAPNVHTGGGAVLLNAFLKDWSNEIPLVAWFDSRAKGNILLPKNIKIEWVKPSFFSRIKAEWTLARKSRANDYLLCFHGLPPLLSNRARLHIFQQNRNYLGLVPLGSFNWRTRQRLRIEQLIAYLFRHRCRNYWVQTDSMAREVRSWYGKGTVNITVLPFIARTLPLQHPSRPTSDFIYVADGESHKNHKRLIEAWIILSKKGLNPSLTLTLSDRYDNLITWIQNQALCHSLSIFNTGTMTHQELLLKYAETKALIFPSISESFGLPLIEASQAGLPVIAGELDFVRDVCSPIQCFDPMSPTSIARAVERFLGKEEFPQAPTYADKFINNLLNSATQK